MITDCRIYEPEENISDHLPVSVSLQLPMRTPYAEEHGTEMPTFPRVNWGDPTVCSRFEEYARHELNTVKRRIHDADWTQEDAAAAVRRNICWDQRCAS
jgi:hypothetical protein